jgi:hypothetical protein
MILYRHCDPRFPFLWESADQPPARWHGTGEGPVQYFADTPDGAWAEFVRHEEIRDAAELENVRRALWAVEVRDGLISETPHLDHDVLTGGLNSYEQCRCEAWRLRVQGARSLRAVSAALIPGGARGWKVDGGVSAGPERDGVVVAIFGLMPDAVGWAATIAGRPRLDLLRRVRHL